MSKNPEDNPRKEQPNSDESPEVRYARELAEFGRRMAGIRQQNQTANQQRP